MKIKKLVAYQILDSRATPTIKVEMVSENEKTASFCVPAGASKGGSEAIELRDRTKSYSGNGVQKAVDLINNKIGPKLIGSNLGYQKKFDEALINLDSSPQKSQLGGNTILALSGAYLRLSAAEGKMPLFAYISKITNYPLKWPQLFANVVNGGKHAPGLSIQEFMIVPDSIFPSQAIAQIVDFYANLQKELVKQYGPTSMLSGDEGGMAPVGATSEQIISAIYNLGSQKNISIGLDVAANSLFRDNEYRFENNTYSPADFAKFLQNLVKKYELFFIEDPLIETDVEGFSNLKSTVGKTKIIGDDISVTNSDKISALAKQGVIDGVIIKPNQIGTFTETFDAIAAAKDNNLLVIISHRSGETTDDTIIDLACGVGADGVKLGAPRHGERIAKYNRLLEIEEQSK